MMTRQDYNVLAAAIHEQVTTCDIGDLAGIYIAARAIAKALEKDNPRFDVVKFLDACGLPST